MHRHFLFIVLAILNFKEEDQGGKKLEFTMEGHRFFDLQRRDNVTGYMANVLNAYIQHETHSPDYNFLYKNGASFIKGKNEVYPFPRLRLICM